MTGVIWFVQIVHYPLFRFVGRDSFEQFSITHSGYASYVVTVPMLVELVSSVILLKWYPENLSYNFFIFGFILVLLIWMSTFLMQVPAHRSLSNGYDYKSINHLVKSNWIRTILWSIRSVLMTYLIYKLL